MRSAFSNTLWALLLTALMLGSMVTKTPELPEEEDSADAGRQGVEAECEGLTFEDMFNYSHADFNIEINDDWETAYVEAVAWVNGTMADDVRTDFDTLFEVLGTDNGWLSSDEYQAVRNIAAQCVEQTNPRFGLRSGAAHRGGEGVNWYNATWRNTDEHPMILEEWNLMPMNHIDERSCQSSPNSDCVEIPVVPITSGRNCDTTINDPDECRMIIWLNATLEFNGLFGQASDQFTVAMNTSNMTNSDLDVTYPPLEGLRVGLFEECDGRRINQANNDNQGSAPAPGECTSDNTISTSSRLVNINGDTRLKVETHIEYDMAIWPDGQDMFFDMTTVPPDVDNPPTWTVNALADGSIIPIADDGQVLFLTSGQMEAWADDDQGTPLISCSGADGWAMSSDADGLSAVPPAGQDSTTLTCMATDSSSQTSDSRTYTLQIPMRITGDSDGDMASITMTPTANMPEMTVTVSLSQSNAQSTTETVTVSDVSTTSISLSSMSPGPIWIEITASGTGMSNFAHTFDVGLEKASTPPSLSLATYEWIDETYDMIGNFNDPDGDTVTISATNDGYAWGDVELTGNGWWVNGPGIDSATSNNLIVITACDSWGGCTSIEHTAGETPGINVEPPPPPPASSEDGGGLPGFGLLAALGAIAIAGLSSRRKQ
jgi:hypothetical protein